MRNVSQYMFAVSRIRLTASRIRLRDGLLAASNHEPGPPILLPIEKD
jgi:hypothetical protein